MNQAVLVVRRVHRHPTGASRRREAATECTTQDTSYCQTAAVLPRPVHASEDPGDVRRIVEANPWCTIVSVTSGGPVASHYPVLLDDEADALTLITHVGRPDERIHEFGDREVLVIAMGHHGYISPSWYVPGTTPAPTWNFSVAHMWGVPEILGFDENLRNLGRLVARFEREVESPQYLDPDWGAQLAKGTVGLRIPVARFQCKVKLSADKSEENRRRVIAALRAPGPYTHPELADEMERELDP
jgi:transcriptional regulator